MEGKTLAQDEYLPPTLVIQQGPDTGKSFNLDKNIITIGSTEENDIVINDPDVSAHHALISRREGAWVIEDLGSKSGVWINAKRVKQPVYLRDGTRINLGPNVMLTAQGAGLGAAEAPKKGGCWKPTLLGLIGLILIITLLLATAAVGYFYIYPRYFQGTASGEYPPNPGPEVTFQEPLPGAQFQQGDSFLVFVTARDEEGVNRIDLWVNDQLVASQSSPDNEGLNPFSLHHGMSADEPGRYMMVARAFNPSGEMGESLTINIEVSGEQAAEPTPDSAIYIAEEGDTIEKIAQKSNNTAGGIQNANPGIKNPVKDKSKVNVNNPPDQKKPDPPQKGAGVNPLPGGAADILPGFKPGALPSIKIAEMLPVKIFPDKDSISLLPGFKLKDPDPLKAVYSGECKVTLTWTDVEKEDGYKVYRQIAGEIKPREIKSLGPNVGNYVDTVPGPAIYDYKVAAHSGAGIQAQTADSNYWRVEVPETKQCKSTPMYKQLVFQPVSFYPTAKNIPLGSIKLQPVHSRSFTYRIPTAQSTYFPAGELGSQYKLTWPAPEYLYRSDDANTRIKIFGTGGDPSKGAANLPAPTELKSFEAIHFKKDLSAPDSKEKLWPGKAEGFNLWYKVWIENWVWKDKSFSSTIPSPTNLRIIKNQSGFRELAWDFDKNYLDRIDGFILYRKYSCPGKNEQVKFPEPISKEDNNTFVNYSTEPVGCSCTYQMSAYGPEGESKPSEPQKEKCFTESPSDSLEVTFNDLTIDKSKINSPTGAAASEIYLFANQYSRRSARMLLEGKKYLLNEVPLDGEESNNSVTVGMAPGEILRLGFYVPDICESKDFVIQISSPTWQGFDNGYFIESPGGFCKVSVNIKDRASGPAPIPGAEPQIKSPIGLNCARDSECETGFCDGGICAPSGDGKLNDYCHKNAHCESGVCQCPTGRDGKTCRDFDKNLVKEIQGACKAGFKNGDFCTKDTECASGYCANEKCAPPIGTGRLGDYCHNEEQCGNHYCVCPSGKSGKFCKDYKYFTSDPGDHGYCGYWYGLENGASCNDNDQCSSRYCANGQCAPIDKTGLTGDYCHHNNHCLNGTCWDCGEKDGAFCEKNDNGKYKAGKCAPP